VAKQSTEKWEGCLEIPYDLPPTRLGGSKLIVITYAIEVMINAKNIIRKEYIIILILL
jgi:hypothetical protein